MLESTGDYLARRALEMQLGRGDQLVLIQKWLNGRWPGQVRALRLQKDILTLTTVSSSMSSELRLQQTTILAACKDCGLLVKRLQIQIRGA